MNEQYMPRHKQPLKNEEAALLSADVLAYVGDSVHSVYVRSRLATCKKCKIRVLHSIASKEVSAPAQAVAIKNIESILTEDESTIFKRCRNSCNPNVPKHSSVAEYNLASGFEGLIGYLYLTGQDERLASLMEIAYPNTN
ncbi:MAG TPA: ribonuclease III domain-containing protein [Clostridia bacterium]|jgi:ribonuclease-3 family protein|nr:ribonuclease III domain-containing protein [Clostridia bacterium]